MELKVRLQRVLQILEESERMGTLSDVERDILLAELREAYTELKFGKTENEETVEEQVAEPAEEPAVEESAVEEPAVELPIAPITPITPTEKSEEIEDNLSTLNSQLSTPKRSALLSLYEDAPTPVLGEQFHEAPSVADTIACPKGVAESAPVASLREAIGVADKFMLIRELFGSDANTYEVAIDALDKQPSFDDCLIYIAEHYVWSPNSEGTKYMIDLLQRKYNA